jgi:hypothetical protein
MPERAHEPPRTGSAAGRGPRAEPPLPQHALLDLQRRIGNREVGRMLARKPEPSHLGTQAVTDLYGKGTDADRWASDVRDREHFLALYSELAGLLHATAIEDVKGTAASDINAALRPAGDELKPGLNFAARMSDRGQTGYLIDGQFTGKLPTTREGSLPTVAIVLGPGAFEARNKASTLAVLRHEMEHAFHDRMAVGWLKRWREDGKAAKQSFGAWLGRQSLAGADLALVSERIDGTKINTEALAHLEGFVAGFPLEAADVSEGAHPVYMELEVAADGWLDSDSAVQAEFSTRLKALGAGLKGQRSAAFAAALKRLKAHDARLAKLVDPLLK